MTWRTPFSALLTVPASIALTIGAMAVPLVLIERQIGAPDLLAPLGTSAIRSLLTIVATGAMIRPLAGLFADARRFHAGRVEHRPTALEAVHDRKGQSGHCRAIGRHFPLRARRDRVHQRSRRRRWRRWVRGCWPSHRWCSSSGSCAMSHNPFRSMTRSPRSRRGCAARDGAAEGAGRGRTGDTGGLAFPARHPGRADRLPAAAGPRGPFVNWRRRPISSCGSTIRRANTCWPVRR